ncbi:lipid-A-disaccharide synthase [Methylophaga pinxianii]|uniref:lipid-A-disaccharide synthase n=1 Tax=Methylophaga pinxianii TaxID=2881052 RepID=UPI001CF13585|nr:lipid-A-disaccharide synthase [Methylophaga pinxianii]MCB2426861.1 lipid-A-disaccharide synthase [Methylophaga pinxianii]UPH47025.1 lipid-A-disaccharide synthase [Methylophaga pinxianii]
MSNHIYIVAGEASGEAHAARLVTALKQHQPAIYITGIGGDKMRAAGADISIDFAELAVMGLVEVIKRYPKIKGIFNQVVEELRRQPPDLLILVDYPGFNLKLAKQAKKLGIKVLYYISPKIWAWRAGRIEQIKRDVDHMAVLFPFEQEIYQSAGVEVSCVGHPLVDAVHTALSSSAAREKFNLENGKRVIGLFPGSRRSEISALLPVMLAAAERIEKRHFPIQIIVPQAPGIDEAYLQQYLSNSILPIKIIKDDFYDVIKACDAIVAASGTVTLEIALIGVPHFITYKVSPWSYRILKRLVKIPYVGLCNIVTQRPVIKELLQDDVTDVRLEQQLMDLLTHPQRLQHAEQIRIQVREALGPSGGADNAAELVLSLLSE